MAHILIAEDDHNISDLLVRFLTRLGHTIQVARDGLAALAHLDSQAFDLLITDLNLPHLSGVDLIRRVRSSSSQPPIVVCSGLMCQSPDVASFADRLLPKPFTVLELQSTIAELLARPAHR